MSLSRPWQRSTRQTSRSSRWSVATSLKVLERTQGKKAEAARLLGIHLKTLNRKLKQYRISR